MIGQFFGDGKSKKENHALIHKHVKKLSEIESSLASIKEPLTPKEMNDVQALSENALAIHLLSEKLCSRSD